MTSSRDIQGSRCSAHRFKTSFTAEGNTAAGQDAPNRAPGAPGVLFTPLHDQLKTLSRHLGEEWQPQTGEEVATVDVMALFLAQRMYFKELAAMCESRC